MKRQNLRRAFAGLIAATLALGGVVAANAAEPELQNLALNAEVSASGVEEANGALTAWEAERAVDGLVGLMGGSDQRTDFSWRDDGNNFRNQESSRWSSNKTGDRWLSVDLGEESVVDHVTIYWGKQFGQRYKLETSLDGTQWTAVEENGSTTLSATASQEDTVDLGDVAARYVRVTITRPNSEYSTGIWEFEVWGTEKVAEPENLARLETTTVTASGREIEGQWGPELAVDGKVGLVTDTEWQNKEWLTTRENHVNPQASRWSANNADGVWLALDLGAEANVSSVKVVWGKQFGSPYRIEASANGTDWRAVTDDLTGSDSETVDIPLTGVQARYIRLFIAKRSATYAMSVWEFEVWGTWTNGAPEPEPEPVDDELPSVVPEPVTYKALDDEGFVLSPESDIVYQGEAAKAEAEKLAETLRVSTGYDLDVVAESTDDVPDIEIVIGTDEQLEQYVGTNTAEGYFILSNVRQLGVAAATTDGLYNGIQTIYQLFGPFSVADFTTNGPWEVPALQIMDYPRYEWRAVMLDPARSFLTVDEIKQAVDVLSMYKINVLHLHLTDDQGWRVEITNEGRVEGDDIDYTRLAEIAGDAAMGTTQYQQLPGIRGYYTQDDLREIVAYANAHHIEVVPEVDMPGHSQGILHAIPQLNSAESSHDGTVDPETGEKIENPAEWICAPAQTTGDVGGSYLDYNNEYTWMFLEHVVKQITDICGSEYIHIGGDETHQLNTDYLGRAVEFLNKAGEMVREMGLTPIGWNEWASSGVDLESGDTIQCWNGQPGANTITGSDARIIWSMAQNAYFPQRPGNNVAGPSWAGGSDGVCNIDDFYNYDPSARAGLSDEYIRGVEGAMWSEHVRGIQDFFFPSFPRAMALAEVGWTPQAKRSGQVADLRERLADTVPALTMKGADFYAEDGLENEPLVAATDLETAPSVGVAHTIAHGYMPMTDIADVTATITWEDGTTQQLGVVQNRPYQAPTAANNNNRAQNGLWELTLTELPEQGTHTGTVTFTAGDKTVTDTVTVTVTGGEIIYGNNIALSAASGEQGEKITVTLSDFAPSASVSLSFGDTELGSVTVDENGAGTYEFTVPAVEPGTYQVTTDPAGSGAEFEVTPAFSPVVTLYPATAAPGFEVSVTVTGLEPEKDATLTSKFGEVTLTADADGAAEATIAVPEDATTGSYEVSVTQGWWNGSATLTIAGDALAHPIDQELYEIVGFSSEETTGEGTTSGFANAAIDGDPSTYWHSAWQSGSSTLPGYITIDLGAEYDVDGVSYLPRQSNANGLMKDYKIFVTAENPNGVPDGTPAAQGTFPDIRNAGSRDVTVVNFDEPVTGRYVTIVATSTLAGNNFVGAAELVVSGLEHTEPGTDPEPEPTMYTVSFVGVEGVADQEVADGETATEPKVAERAGYTFNGWFAEGADKAYDFDTPVTGDLTLTASWSLDAPVVSVEADKADPVEGETVTLKAKVEHAATDVDFHYLWTENGQPVLGAGESTYAVTASGTYSVTVTVESPEGITASATSNTIEVTFTKPAPGPVDKTALLEALETASALDLTGYTDDSVAVLETAVAKAEAVRDDADATAEQVEDAASAIYDAIKALVEKPGEPEVDTDALLEAIENAGALDESEYTAESWGALQDALDAAREALESGDQATVDAAAKALDAAIEALVAAPEPGEDVKPGGDDQKPEPGDDDEKPGEDTKPGGDDEQPGEDTKPGDDDQKPEPGDDQQPGEGQKPGEDQTPEPGDDQQSGDDAKPGDNQKPSDDQQADPSDDAKPGTQKPSDQGNAIPDTGDATLVVSFVAAAGAMVSGASLALRRRK